MTEIIKDKEYWKQYRKDWYKKHKQDPEWNAKHLEYHRDWKKKAKEEPEYRKDVNGEQFVIRNPNAKTTCGCGSSFSA